MSTVAEPPSTAEIPSSAPADAGEAFTNFLNKGNPQAPNQNQSPSSSPASPKQAKSSPSSGAETVKQPDKPVATKPAETQPTTEQTKAPDEKKQPKKVSLDFAKADAKPADATTQDATTSDKEVNIANLRKDRDALRTELETLKKSAAQPNKQFQQQLETLQKERDEYKTLIERVALERSPEFRQRYDSEFTRYANLAKGNVPDDLKDTVFNAIKSGSFGPEFDNAVEMLEPAQQRRIESIRTQIENLKLRQQEEIEKAGEFWQQRDQAAQKEREAQQKEAAELFDATWAKAAQAIEIIQPIEGDEDHNAFIDQVKTHASNMFNGSAEPEDLAKLAIWGVLGPQFREALYAEVNVSKGLRDEIARLKGAQPGGAGAAPADVQKGEEPDAAKAFLSRLNSK